MPIEQIMEPTLVRVTGVADKELSTGVVRVDITISPGPLGFPADEELDPVLLTLFNTVAGLGWVGSVTKEYMSATEVRPDPDDST